MSYFLILKDGEPERLITEMDQDKTKEEDMSFYILANQVLNIYSDKELAEICLKTMSVSYPSSSFKIVELCEIDTTQEWN